MNSEEISKLFKLDQVDFEKCISSEEYESKLRRFKSQVRHICS